MQPANERMSKRHRTAALAFLFNGTILLLFGVPPLLTSAATLIKNNRIGTIEHAGFPACPCFHLLGVLIVLPFSAIRLIAQHEAEQTIDDAWIGTRATDGDVRHNANVAFANDLHQLHDRIALRA
jgi:hypothetical protein